MVAEVAVGDFGIGARWRGDGVGVFGGDFDRDQFRGQAEGGGFEDGAEFAEEAGVFEGAEVGEDVASSERPR